MPWAIAGTLVGAGLGYLNSKDSSNSKYNSTYSGGSSNTQQTYIPNDATLGSYGWLAGTLENLMQTPSQYYPGQGYVGPSEYTKEGVENQRNALNTMTQNYNMLSTAADVANNPYVQGQLRANESSVLENLYRNAMPTLQSGAVGVNNLGSSRLGLAQGQAIGDTMTGLARTNANTMNTAYQAGLGAQQSALNYTDQLLQNYLEPGKTVESYQQKALDDAIARWNYQYTEPWERLTNATNLMGSTAYQNMGTTYGGSGSYSYGSTPNSSYQSPYASILGGALTGYGFGSS